MTPGVFTCDICNKQMTTAIGLKKHKKVIHMKVQRERESTEKLWHFLQFS